MCINNLYSISYYSHIPKAYGMALRTQKYSLLETPQKLMVKLLNSRLAQLMARHKRIPIRLYPRSFTMELIRVLNKIIEDIKKELWVLFQDCYTIYRSDLTNGYNRIFTEFGLTNKYKVLV